MKKLDSILNKIHLADSLEFMKQMPDKCIDLTLTSPPFYADDIYILDTGPEFGWSDYSEYLDHLYDFMNELYRLTKLGGKLVIILTNTPKLDEREKIIGVYPIIFDFYNIAINCEWEIHTEVVWHKTEPSYSEGAFYPSIPNTQPISHHDWILVFRKKGKVNTIGQNQIASVWSLPAAGPINDYNHEYNSFPDELVNLCLESWSVPNTVILDPYAGSGQVIRLALKKNRNAIGIEIDKRWTGLWKDINST